MRSSTEYGARADGPAGESRAASLPVLAAAAWLVLMLPSEGRAQQAPGSPPDEPTAGVAWQLDADLVSKYLVGGLRFSEDPIVQPSLSASFLGVTLTGLGVYYTGTDELEEADVFADYSRDLGGLSLSGGVGLYNFRADGGWEPSVEVYASATWNGLLQPTLTVAHDFDVGNGTLAEASVGHGLDLGRATLAGTLSLAYSGRYYREGTGFAYVRLALEAPIALGSGFVLTPRLAALQSLDRPEIQSTVYGGVGLGVSF